MADRGEPKASCPEWHADGTAGETDRGSRLAATPRARAKGEARPRRHGLVGKPPEAARQICQMSPLQRSGCGGLSAAEPDSSPARPGPPAMGVAIV